MKPVKKRILCHLFYTYLKLLEKTVRIEWRNPEAFSNHNIVGFWHEDSFAMNLVLQKISRRQADVSVLVTEDERGDYIQYLLEKCGGEAVRVGFGFCNAGTLKELLASLQEERRSVAIAMDGPMGPRHIPKKLTYFLSEKSKTELTGITIAYSAKLSLSNRWDHYHIPLPFTRLTICFDNYGIASCHYPPKIKVYQGEPACSIMISRELLDTREKERNERSGNEPCINCGR